ncbi:MAG: glutaredoxin family protein [Chlamydiae bacterium]|nr:glutaredoxin family protein [Chlamydiota bacterium]
MIVLYTAPNCPFCLKTKELFDRNKLAYTEIDVSQDEFGWKEMVNKSGQMAVPVIDIDGYIMIGFDEFQLRDILDLRQ